MAAQTTYQYVLKMKDKMSGSLKKAGKKGGKAYDRLQRAQSKLNKLNKKFGMLAKVSFAAAVGGAVMLSKKLVTSTIKTAEMGDEAAKTGRRLGITAEELQKLRFAADRQGVSASLLDSSFMALQKRVGELRVESGGLYTYLSKKGETTFMNQLKSAQNTGEAFSMMVTKLEGIKDPMDRAAFANAAFSRAGLDMIKMMEAGGEGLDALKQQAADMGAVMSNEAAAKSEKFVDTMTNFKATMKGLRITLGSRLMPIIQEFVEKMQGWVMTNKELISQKLQKFFGKVADAAQWIASNFGKIVTGVKILIGVLAALKIAQIAVNIAMMANPVGLIIAGFVALAAGIYLVITRWEEFKELVAQKRDDPAFHLAKMHVPLLRSIDLITFFSDRWEGIKRSFRTGDTILEKIQGLGKAAWSFLLKPVEAVLKAVRKLGPGFQKAYDDVKNIRGWFDKGMGEKTTASRAAMMAEAERLGLVTRESVLKAGAKKRVQARMDRRNKQQTAAAASAGLGAGGLQGLETDAGDEAGTAISAGGSKQTNITISLQNLVNELNISGGDFEETTDNMVTQVREALLRVLNSANQTAIG